MLSCYVRSQSVTQWGPANCQYQTWQVIWFDSQIKGLQNIKNVFDIKWVLFMISFGRMKMIKGIYEFRSFPEVFLLCLLLLANLWRVKLNFSFSMEAPIWQNNSFFLWKEVSWQGRMENQSLLIYLTKPFLKKISKEIFIFFISSIVVL